MSNLAVFGAGRMGLFYIRLILNNPDCKLLYIVVKSEEKVSILKNLLAVPEYCTILTTTKIDTVYNDKRLNAVVICSPTHAHDEQVKRCLKSGLSVYCEKPISFNDKITAECYQLAKEKNLHLFCAFQRRFDASFKNAYEAVRSGSLGKLHFVKSCSRDGSLPDINYLRTSGGFFKDSTVHDIDMICWIANEFPNKVFAQGHAHRNEFAEINDFDSVTVTMKFRSGLIGIIDQDRCAAYGYDQRLEIFGERGMIQIKNPSIHNAEISSANGVHQPTIVDDFLTRYKDAYEKQLLNFINLVTRNEGTIIHGDDVLAVEKIAEAAMLSCKTNEMIDLK